MKGTAGRGVGDRAAGAPTWIDLLQRRAAETPETVLYRFLADGNREAHLSCAQLDRRARAIAARLLETGRIGERVLLIQPPGLEFVTSLFACLYAGMVAIPVYPPEPKRLARTLPRFRSVADDAGAHAVLGPRALPSLRDALIAHAPELARLNWISVCESELDTSTSAADWRRPDVGPDDLAVVQYTSGSTASPRGVMLSHANLLANSESILHAFEHGPQSRGVIWLPPYHDMGLVGGVLQPLFAGFPVTLLAPADFLRRPLSWLRTIAQTGATTSGGPTFAYELCLRRIAPQEREELDLSSWEVAFVGAEPVRPDTLERFAAAFAPAGFRARAFYPCYGLAEGTLIVSGGTPGRAPVVRSFDRSAAERGLVFSVEADAPGARSLVGCGRGRPGSDMRIADPDSGRALPPGRIGEIWVSGPSVALGYWRQSDESSRVFRARAPDGAGPFLRTGDLGFLHEGELFVTGRLKDLIILHGRNLYPEDLEATVERCHPALRAGSGAAFALEVAGEERLFVVYEAELTANTSADAVIAAVRRAVAAEHEAHAYAVILLEPRTIPKTASGKIQRRACRTALLEGSLAVLAEQRGGEPEASPTRRVAPSGEGGSASVTEAAQGEVVARHAGNRLDEPVAVVGMACRFPGAPDLERFWTLLEAGDDAVREVPEERWNLDDYYHPDPAVPARLSTRWGGFLDGVDRFDASFFGISPREASRMDPQQRLLLEVSWEAFENAGIPVERVAGSRAGVYVGIGGSDYSTLSLQLEDHLEQIDPYVGTGNAHSIAANRISYLFDLRGPSLAIDTACSSSLLAIHLACQGLRCGESDLALAGGVNLTLAPEVTIAFSKARMMSPDGRCKAFDADADGYVRAEGCGMLLLKRLSDAQRAGDRILGLLRGSATNQDGRTPGITVPNRSAQEQVIRDALDRAGVEAHQVGYVEAHGTGTAVGDPIEIEAIATVFGARRDAARPCWIGSVKANVGHLETASGVAGLIKVLLCLEHEAIPPQIHLRKVNPRIRLEDTRLGIPRERVEWTRGAAPRFAAVSSYGFGGANVHAIVSEPPQTDRPSAPILETERPTRVLPISARSEAALRTSAERLAAWLGRHPEAALSDVCFSAGAGRSHFEHRAAFVASTSEQLREQLAAFAVARAEKPLGADPGRRSPKIAFLFTGQGAQYAGMGSRLYETHPSFRDTIDRCDQILRRRLEIPLLELLRAPSAARDRLDETGFTQPALFALEYALATLWRSWGIFPDVVMGHSVGEYVAACVAGVFDLEAGLDLIAERARLMQSLPPGGAMATVFTSSARAREVLSHHAGVDVAAENAPEVTVLSGSDEQLQTVLLELESRGISSRRIPVSHAFHSPLVEPILDSFAEAADRVSFRPPAIPLVSNLTGLALPPREIPKADYWRRHVRQPVRFADGMQALAELGCTVFLEIGPHPTLIALGRQCLPRGVGAWLPSLRRHEDDGRVICRTLAKLYVRGAPVDWAGVDRGLPRARVALPSYPFERRRYWGDDTSSALHPSSPLHPRAASASRARLLGARVPAGLAPALFESRLSTRRIPYLADHRLLGSAVFPGTGYMALALQASRALLGDAPHEITSGSFQQPLFLSADRARRVQTIVHPMTGGEARFCVLAQSDADSTRDASSWVQHASGAIRAVTTDGISDELGEPPDAIRARCAVEIPAVAHYAELRARGLDYGPAFQGVRRLWRCDGEALAELVLAEPLRTDASRDTLHPALLDAALQALAAGVPESLLRTAGEASYLPVGFERVRVLALPSGDEPLWSHARVRPDMGSDGALFGDVDLIDAEGRCKVQVAGLRLQRLGRRSDAAAETELHHLYEIRWRTVPIAESSPEAALPSPGAQQPTWLVFSDTRGVSKRICDGLRARGARCVRVERAEEPASASTIEEPDESLRAHPLDPDDFARVLARASCDPAAPLEGVVYLWGLDATLAADEAALDDADTRGVLGALHVVQALARRGTPSPRLWLVTRGSQTTGHETAAAEPAQAPLWGLARTVALEHPSLRCTTVDLDPRNDGADDLLLELLADSAEDQLAFRAGQRLAPRLCRRPDPGAESNPASEPTRVRPLRLPRSERVVLDIASTGRLDRLYARALEPRPLPPGTVEIEVCATGLNFRDVMNAMGLYPGGPIPFGAECAGRVCGFGDGVPDFRIGDDVMALAPESFASHAVTLASLVVRKPARLSYEEAATIPVTFLSAHYALHHLAHLKSGERVLIHAGAGGVGQAAIQLAQLAQAEIFATAGSPEKRDYLATLGVGHVFDSRTLEFADQILERTQGRGVDVVLNSLPGAFISRSMAVLAPYGRFVEIGRTDIYQNASLDLYPFRNNLSYFAVDLDQLARERAGLVHELFLELLEKFEDRRLRPLPRKVYAFEDVVEAFRHMARRRNIGKVVVSAPRSGDETRAKAPGSRGIRGDATYLVTGGLGGLGLALTRWLVARGARHLVLVSRREPRADARAALGELRDRGADVRVERADVGDDSALARIISDVIADDRPLRGVFHAAGILDDGLILQQTAERFRSVARAKQRGAWHLHRLTRQCPLEYFVLFSSVASVLGSPGQSGYTAANAFLDALAHARRAQGRPALCVNWGPWAEVGMAARSGADRALDARGMHALSPEVALSLLERLLEGDAPQVAAIDVSWPRLLGLWPGGHAPPLLTALADEASQTLHAAPDNQAGALRRALLSLEDAQRHPVLVERIQAELAAVMGLAPDELAPEASLAHAGLDSLMALELKENLESALAVTLPIERLMEDPSIADVARVLLEQIDADHETEPTSPHAPTASVSDESVSLQDGSNS